MDGTRFTATARGRRRIGLGACLGAVTAGVLALAACSSGSTTAAGGQQAASQAGSKLILFELAFPCGLNSGISQLCAGVEAGAKKLPAGYTVQVKTGVNYADNTAFNSLIQTSLQLNPAGLIIFPGGPAAQTPVMNQACAKGVKIVIMESPATGVKCQSSFVGTNNVQLGADDAKWLIAHPPASKEVGIVTQTPGEYVSTDDRVKGFTQTVTAAGYHVAATAVTNLSADSTRTAVTNMVTAHPGLGAVFSANGPIGDGTAQALKGKPGILQLTLDGQPNDVQSIKAGTMSADAVSNAYTEGELTVQYMAAALQGKQVPATALVPSQVIDQANSQQYLQAGGLK
jgi:ribose transport system substrate-binding protein